MIKKKMATSLSIIVLKPGGSTRDLMTWGWNWIGLKKIEKGKT
jgi:hypothetical protein